MLLRPFLPYCLLLLKILYNKKDKDFVFLERRHRAQDEAIHRTSRRSSSVACALYVTSCAPCACATLEKTSIFSFELMDKVNCACVIQHIAPLHCTWACPRCSQTGL